MRTHLTLLTIGLAWPARVLGGYGIDESCKDSAFIKMSVEAAIDMAAMAHAAIGDWDNPNRDPNVQRLLGLLFGDTQKSDLERIKEVFQGVMSFSGDEGFVKPTDAEGAERKVNIYCNLDRVQKHKDGMIVDTSTGKVLEDGNELEACSLGDIDLAVTWDPHSRRSGNPPKIEKYLPSQVTICPWFYDWAHTRTLKDWNHIGFKSGLALPVIPLATRFWPFTPIDAITLLDKVMLHELTHTYAGGRCIDVEMEKEGAPHLGVAYGWKAATALVRQAPEAMGQSALWNSDSYALFGSGVRLLEASNPVYIKNDGWVTDRRPSKRDVPLELRRKQTPVAFEGFITSIREERAAMSTAMGNPGV